MPSESSVLIIGGGIGAVQAALDLADAKRRVYLVEKTPAIGGYMAMLDKTFPTNDCSICILSPKLVTCARHPNIELLTLSEVLAIDGEAGNFRVRVKRNARSVDISRCTGCGDCLEKCPVKLPNEFEQGLTQRRAIYRLYAQAVPNAPTIDRSYCLKFTKDRCGNCARVCKAGAIDYNQKDETVEITVGAVVVAEGSVIVDPAIRPEFGYKRFANVVTSLEFERILSASGPFAGHILRPGDKKEPKKIAWVQCFGSRDETVERSYCSSVCCMYAVKEAVIAREHSQNIEPTVFYMDLRAFGKEFDRYIERAEKQYGVRFVPGRVAEILEEPESKDLIVRYGEKTQKSERFDLVVLSCGLSPRATEGLKTNQFGFPATSLFEPVETSCPGIFIAGSCAEPQAIPETVTQASAAAVKAMSLTAPASSPATASEQDRGLTNQPSTLTGLPPRIGVFICHCGINIGGIVRVPEVVEFAKNLPGVVYAEENLYSCSADTLKKIKARIEEQHLTRVVVASCSPRTHEPLFQATLTDAGMNPYLFAMANIREQCSWVHPDPDQATNKAKDLVKMAIARVRRQEPLPRIKLPVNQAGLVIGGGIAGMTSALALADAGFQVYLIEREGTLGGIARTIYKTIEGEDVRARLKSLIERVNAHPLIKVYTNATIKSIDGFVGSFETTVLVEGQKEKLQHGTVIVATGAKYRQPDEYLYGKSERIKTQKELEEIIASNPEKIKEINTVVMIQCVGSREGERNYCSRICCAEAIKNALAIKEIAPHTEVYILYRDIRTYGFRESYYRRARELGVQFIRYNLKEKPLVELTEKEPIVLFNDPVLDLPLKITPDLLVLSSGIIAQSDSSELAQMLKVPLQQDGFFLEAHAKLRPVDFATEGVFLAGSCHYPKFIDETVSSAQAAAGRAATVLAQDFIEAEPYQAVVNPERCSACGMCEAICAYRAIAVKVQNEKTGRLVAVVNQALCKGCGACAANCRSQAIEIKGFTSENICREIAALFT
ncbi:MAG: FAD-dependent oxidoreductase [bacterium]